jgi:hypothetical protein
VPRWFDLLGMISVAAIGLLVIVTLICLLIPFPEDGAAGSPHEHSHNQSGGFRK